MPRAGPEAAAPRAVRRARPADLDELVGLWLDIGRHHEPIDPYFALRTDAGPEARRLLAAWLRDPDAAAFLCTGEPSPGLCLVRADRAPPIQQELRRGLISDVGVRPSCRRQGHGRLLVEAAVAWLRERGVARVEVRVARGNPEGQAFWRALGFGDFMDVLHRRL